MAKKIIDMVNDKVAAMGAGGGDAAAANELSELAVAAINDGIKSRAWEKYMLHFVEKDNKGNVVNPAQLARLLGEDDKADDPDIRRSRAYLVGNAVCGTGSPFTDGLHRGVESIDKGMGGDDCEFAWKKQPMDDAADTTAQPTAPQGTAAGGTNP